MQQVPLETISNRNKWLQGHSWLMPDLNTTISQCIQKKKKCSFCRTPCPLIVEPSEHFDEEDGLPEKVMQKIPKYYK